ncbi:PE-PGRS family protein (fragment) [uncultured Mycobacterium sp.]|uniref:PE-PGRS family protein n=1 Tax=uncultured Mycobacterium sp. TaxID=171292 RepID=A0A1Y5PTL3_9MYCO
MKLLQRPPAAAVAGLVSAMIAVGMVSAPGVQAQTRITVPGAGPLYYPNIVAQLPVGRLYFAGTSQAGGPPLSLLAGYDRLNHQIGANWFPDSTAQVVNYPASMGLLSFSLAAPGVDDAVAMGRGSLDDQIMNAVADGDPVVIAGLSEGTLVINRELAYLATTPSAPPADLLKFALFSGPESGLFDVYLPAGAWLPLVNYTVHRLADSQYDVSVVFHQYDGWADPPDRPWNLLAVVNSLVATLYLHNGPALALPSDAVEVSRVTSRLGGTTTTYMIPSATLPLLGPLQQLGVPERAVDALNSVLKPIVDAGYSTVTPADGPYFSQGRLVFKSPTTEAARADGGTTIVGPRERATSARPSNGPRAITDSARGRQPLARHPSARSAATGHHAPKPADSAAA